MFNDFYKDKTILVTGATGFLGNFSFSILNLYIRQGVPRENPQISAHRTQSVPLHCPKGR